MGEGSLTLLSRLRPSTTAATVPLPVRYLIHRLHTDRVYITRQEAVLTVSIYIYRLGNPQP